MWYVAYMTKSIRISEYLYEQIGRLAKKNRRPLINQLELLLEQALKMDSTSAARSTKAPALGGQAGMTPQASAPEPVEADAQPRDVPNRTIEPVPYDRTFKPDFKQPPAKKKGRR